MNNWYTLNKAVERLNKSQADKHWCDDDLLQAAAEGRLEIFSNALGSDRLVVLTRREHLKGRQFTLSASNRYALTDEGEKQEIKERGAVLKILRDKYPADSSEVLSAEQSTPGLIQLDSDLLPVPRDIVGRLLIADSISIQPRLLRTEEFTFFPLSNLIEVDLTRGSLRISAQDLQMLVALLPAMHAAADVEEKQPPLRVNSREDKAAARKTADEKLQADLNSAVSKWRNENNQRALSHKAACEKFADQFQLPATTLRTRTRKGW